jgi:AmmeMemoRadiSam system protein A
MTIPPDDQQRLLRLARAALEARVTKTPAPAVEYGGALEWPCGAFVTIHARGDLRGCLGRIDVQAPLADTIAHLAAVVSDSDPRFAAVSPRELADIELEISVLTPATEVGGVDEIEIGRHGLIVEQGHRRGLLLPQVATEHGWDRETFLDHACRKASLPPDAWRHGARILIFEAQVFREKESRLGPQGPV